jgi:hypothetical protein
MRTLKTSKVVLWPLKKAVNCRAFSVLFANVAKSPIEYPQ